MYCAECNLLSFDDEKFCQFCGSKLINSMFKCPHCKKEISVASKFCNKCGKPVGDAAGEEIEQRLRDSRGGKKLTKKELEKEKQGNE